MKIQKWFFFAFLFLSCSSFSQDKFENVVYFVDGILVKEDTEIKNDMKNEDIAEVNVVKNKDSLKKIGFEKMDGAVYIVTKEFKKRSDELKKIPTTKQMEMKNGNVWYLNNQVYSGRFIDYYSSGRKKGEGTLKNGKIDGVRKMYYQNGKLIVERNYLQSVPNGLETEYYEDGSIKQKGIMKNGKEDGVWEIYFPNGQVKQRTKFDNGNMVDESVIYYSNGKICATEKIINGKVNTDKNFEEVKDLMNKSNTEYQNGNEKYALKLVEKAIEINPNYQYSYFAKGTMLLNQLKFDEAISTFDKALEIEPYYEFALANRAFARIRKFELGGNKAFENKEITMVTSQKDVKIPDADLQKICRDLQQALFLGDRAEMIYEAQEKYCIKK